MAWALRAAFPVIAQGFLPGDQTIFRAETAALVQVVLLASRHREYMFQAWTDSSSALQCLEAWLGGKAVSSIEAPIGDLLQMLPAHRPTNLRLSKVRAHQDFQDLPDSDLLTAAGNWAADEAAKAAEKSDLSCVPDYTDAVARWSQLQEDRFFMFCQYLLELTKAVVALRKQHSAQGQGPGSELPDGATCDRSWTALQPTVTTWCVDLPFGLGAPHARQPTPWPEWFLLSLLEWGALVAMARRGPQTPLSSVLRHYLPGVVGELCRLYKKTAAGAEHVAGEILLRRPASGRGHLTTGDSERELGQSPRWNRLPGQTTWCQGVAFRTPP